VLRFARPIAGLVRQCLLAAMALLCVAMLPQKASAETRTLKLYYVHTNERAEVTYKRNGKYLSEGLKKANMMLRDWRRNEPTKMDPKTLDILWEVYRASGSRDYVHVISGYRSPATNAMLRRTRGGQAEKSQHMLGKAIDFYLPDVKLSKLRAIAFKVQGGGVGYYPRSGSPFVHVDSGNVRSWPRMSRSELLALFPNGNTVHLPADGKPLPGYQAALAAYKNGKGASSSIVVDNSSSSGKKPTLWAALFGGGADESDDEADVSVVASAPPAKKPVAVASAKPAKPLPVDIAALQPDAMDGGPDASGSGVVASIQQEQAQAAPALEAIAEVAPEFTALPKRDAPVPSAAPRAADEVLVAAVEPIDPAAVKAAEALAEAEIAAIDTSANSNLPADGPVPTPRPVVAIAAAEPNITAPGEAAPSVDIASLSADPQAEPSQAEMRAAFAPVPEAAPTRDAIADLASVPLPTDDLAAEDGAVEIASLPDQGPIPELRVDELSATPEPALVKPAAKATGVIGANLKTGVKTTGKSAKLLTAKIVRKPAVQPLETISPVNPDRFGPSSDQTATNDTPKSKKNGKGPRILPDGSAVVSSGTIKP
jgi:uncharacterized protein YcbK (DUF882 family)